MVEQVPAMRRRRRWPLIFPAIAAGWLLAEIVIAAIGAWVSPAPLAALRRVYRPHPYRVYALIPGSRSKAGHFTINSQGFRGPEIEPCKPSGTVRIACLGDSTTFGEAATADDHTWPARLERRLRERYVKPGGQLSGIEVINAGVPGYTSLESLIHFETWVLDYQPDIAIFDHGLNDAVFMACFRDFSSEYTHARKVFEIPRPQLWEHSLLLSSLFPARRTIANPYWSDRRPSQAEWLDRLTLTDPQRPAVDEAEQRHCFRPERIAVFARNVRNFVFVARGQGVVPVLATVVYAPQAGFFADVVGQINESLRKVATELSVPCVDLAREMPWSAEAFVDASQPRDGPEGLERAGRIFADELIRQKLVERAAAGKPAAGNQR